MIMDATPEEFATSRAQHIAALEKKLCVYECEFGEDRICPATHGGIIDCARMDAGLSYKISACRAIATIAVDHFLGVDHD
jgi:hypothetical protein